MQEIMSEENKYWELELKQIQLCLFTLPNKQDELTFLLLFAPLNWTIIESNGKEGG